MVTPFSALGRVGVGEGELFYKRDCVTFEELVGGGLGIIQAYSFQDLNQEVQIL